MRVRTLAAFAAGVMVAAAGTAFATTKVASIVGTDNQIHGCYLTSAGLLRVVPQGTECRDGESPISWTATGAGPQGVPGPPGAKGDPGARWRGAWVAGTAYSGGDLVRSGGKIWIRQSGLIACFVDRPCSNTISPAGAAGWSVFALDGAQGPRGLDGPRGPMGPAGTSGAVGGWEVIFADVTIEGGKGGGKILTCPGSKRPLGGGFHASGGNVRASSNGLWHPTPSQWGWQFTGWNDSAGPIPVKVTLICAATAP